MEWQFYYDVVCPYAFLAALQVDAIAAQTGTTVRWRPILLGGVLRSVGAPDQPAAGRAAARLAIEAADLRRLAARAGETVRFPPDHPRRTVNAMRLLLATPEGHRRELSLALFRAYWQDNADLSDDQVLARVAERAGADPSVVHADAIRQGLFDTTAEAVERGVFGVPSFVVGDQLFWGVDRVPLVEVALGGDRAVEQAAAAPAPGRRVTFFHDFSSPFSYLASTQIEAVAARAGAVVEWVPILLGALFREIGTPMIPIQAMNPARQSYQGKDLQDWAGWWGVPFTFNTHFPLRTVTALRLALQAPQLTPALYHAAWAEDRDLSDPEVLQSITREHDLDGAALLEGCSSPAVKDQLRANTARAIEAGACGVPTFEVGGQILWGQDRLNEVEALLRGMEDVA